MNNFWNKNFLIWRRHSDKSFFVSESTRAWWSRPFCLTDGRCWTTRSWARWDSTWRPSAGGSTEGAIQYNVHCIVECTLYSTVQMLEYSVYHSVSRVLSFFSSSRDWDSPNPSPAGECAPHPLLPGEVAHSLARVPIPTSGHTLWYTLYVLCGVYWTVCRYRYSAYVFSSNRNKWRHREALLNPKYDPPHSRRKIK